MKQLIVLVDDAYEELELWYPKLRLEEAGYNVLTAGKEARTTYKGKHGYPCQAEVSYEDVKASDLAGIIIPGGFAPDKLRREPTVLKIVKELFDGGKIVAYICHGGWVAISAKIIKGKKVTGAAAIKDDLENAGGTWEDKSAIIDGNLISSRKPADLPEFSKAILSSFI